MREFRIVLVGDASLVECCRHVVEGVWAGDLPSDVVEFVVAGTQGDPVCTLIHAQDQGFLTVDLLAGCGHAEDLGREDLPVVETLDSKSQVSECFDSGHAWIRPIWFTSN